MSERMTPCRGPGGCEDLTFCVCQEMRAQSEKNARLREALEQCAEYFDDRSDVDTRDGEPVANKEMHMLGVVRAALGEK